MWLGPWVYVSFCGVECVIFGRTMEEREEALEEGEETCSARMVVLWAMQALVGG